ncbi:methyltransferase domain-containing protein [Glaesserella parasuis ZJ0906]|uniref:Methyltransferase domain-containing protein n=1 Tax=Glaesserella parasuis ZJ0906 TaxID=1322346 RepID=A0A806J4I1_GLAPU|nr:methyltransferase domain-containing protein [Glaesserella parasuis ZJ0906]AIK90029.1 hypothetical protein JT17_04335 [Glaesserella parasuis]
MQTSLRLLYLSVKPSLSAWYSGITDFLQGETGGFQGETYQDLQNAVEFSLGTLTELERQKLQAFYQQKQQSQQKISHDQARWAFISWQV